ncbi:MAG: protein kinase [Chloroflexota bacterium]
MILSKVAQGGMGAVYEAKDIQAQLADAWANSAQPSQNRLALKEMSFSMLKRLKPEHQQAVIDGFRREFEILNQLKHPNLVRAFQYFEEQGRQFFVMEYIEGQTLESILENLPPEQFLPVECVLEWARQLCEALVYLHAQTPAIIYRDLKPSNVMEVSGTHTVKLFDFGIARFYKPGKSGDTVRFGTDGYLAPEIVARRSQTDEKTDVYALGVMLLQLLTRYDPQIDPWRHPPVRALNPKVPEHIASAIERAMALNPDQRTPSASIFLKELLGPQARPPVSAERAAQVAQSAAPLSAPASVSPGPASEWRRPVNGAAPVVVPATPGVAQGERQATAGQFPASIPTLNLGSVEQGSEVRSGLRVALPPGSSGQVQSSVPWLIPEPANIVALNAADRNVHLNIIARTAGLALANWDGAERPAWFGQTIGRSPQFLQNWLDFHARLLMKLPQTHQGFIQISIPSAPVLKVPVMIEVRPAAWMNVLSWLLVIGMMTLEIGMMMSLIGFVLLSI